MLTPANDTVEDYLNTTNPYAQYSEGGALSEIGQPEGCRPLYVLVFGDEEERATIRYIKWGWYVESYYWDDWAAMQIERGDEALVAKFGIDIRILGFEEWDSDGNLIDKLRYDDEDRLDLPPGEVIDLKFSTTFQGEIAYYIFGINGYNIKTDYP